MKWLKVVTVFPDNARHGLPTIMGVYQLLDGTTGRPLVLIDGSLNDEDLQLAAQITARFGHGKNAEQVEIEALTY